MTAVSVEKKVNGTPVTSPEPRFEYDPVALAEAEAIRARGAAEADAIRAKAAEDARKQRLANDKAERRAAEDQAASEARIAEHNRRRDEADRARKRAEEEAEQAKLDEAQAAAEVAEADSRWRSYALNFYRVCAVVALPVQLSAFYNPDALWLMAAPLMLEGGAWVVQKGAASAVANRRPFWHYRAIAWLLAFIAAGINLWHGLNAFDAATALGTAFASIAGPGVWDLHEHGRIRKRDGTQTRRERKAQRKAEEAEAARKAAEEKRRAAEKEAADKAAAEAAAGLAKARAEKFKDVWEQALELAAALGEITVTEAVWRRAYRNIRGADPGESAEMIRARNAAEKRVEAARSGAPVNTLSKTTNAQRASQIPPARKQRSYIPPARPGRRTKGDTAPYVEAARKQAAITARAATQTPRPNGN